MSRFNEVRYGTLEELYLKNNKLVFAMLSDYTQDIEIKKELASSLWLKVAEDPAKYLAMEAQSLRQYIRVIVKNLYVDHYKANKKQEAEAAAPILDEKDSAFWAFEQTDFYEDAIPYIDEARKCLAEEDRLLICMKFEKNMSSREVGEVLGISEGNVRVRQKRILHKLKKEILRLKKEDGERDE